MSPRRHWRSRRQNRRHFNIFSDRPAVGRHTLDYNILYIMMSILYTRNPYVRRWRHRTWRCAINARRDTYLIIWKACPSAVGQIPDILTISIGPVMNFKWTAGCGQSELLARASVRSSTILYIIISGPSVCAHDVVCEGRQSTAGRGPRGWHYQTCLMS